LSLIQSGANRIDMRINAGTVSSTINNVPMLLMMNPRTVDDGTTFEAMFNELSSSWDKVYAYESTGDTSLVIYTEYWDIGKQIARLWLIMDSITTANKDFYITFDQTFLANTNNTLIGLSEDTSIAIDYRFYVDTLSPISYWRLDETSGTVAKNKYIYNGVGDGVYAGNYSLNQPSLLSNGDGSSVDFISGSVNITNRVTSIGDYSISAMIKRSNSNGAVQNIVSFSYSNSGMLFCYNNQLQIYNGGWYNTGVTLNQNQIYHIVVTFNFTEVKTKVYLDGDLVLEIGVLFGACDFSNIAVSTNGIQHFGGVIDEVFIVPRIITEAEIENLNNLS